MKIVKRTPLEEYKKDENLKKEDITQLREWVEKQPHLPDIDEFDIIQFYHASDYSMQKTKELVDVHYTFRTDAPEFYNTPNYQPPHYKYNVWDVCYVIALPETTPEGYRVVYCGLKDTNASKYHFEIALNHFMRVMTSIVGEQGCCPGYAFIFDINGLSVQHLATVTISLVKKFLFFVQEGVPVKVRAVHMINVTPILDKIMFLAKPFIKKALFDMLYFYSDLDEVYKVVPRHCLPSDLGGTLPLRNELADITHQKVIACSEFLNKDMQLRSDETKRLGSVAKNRMDGSFKKIDID